jgi:hypothetical protein
MLLNFMRLRLVAAGSPCPAGDAPAGPAAAAGEKYKKCSKATI